MFLTKNGTALPFVVEESAHAGVVRVAGKVIADVEKVSGVKPELLRHAPETPYVLCATLCCSPIADALIAQGKLPQAEEIRGAWERFVIAKVDGNLIILGSDKRGTEFGMFELSKYIGVSPLCYWGDADPLPCADIELKDDICTVSREPSVKYRGLFINDEWPCFGTWATTHFGENVDMNSSASTESHKGVTRFGGVNAKMYDHVFELLLRCKANYMWPAMWASVFGEEGPGSLNEELADEYGIVVGNSHHEPCLRAGEEFKHSIRDGAKYGTDWNFVRNREGITRFWADGLKRSGKYEHLITIGMRGEDDSAMLGEDAGLRGNIEYLKDVITTQEALIQEHAGPKSKDQPRLLALYKEVEPFFYGNENVQGLKDWDGLKNTICMLCEDNQGFMRSLPTPEMTKTIQARGCGWGMYYHVDYHGGPVSYEWMPSTPFSLLWEQMCLAYDYGIHDVWILNTGDLKGNEVSLYQFLDLAYDYDKWGSHDVLNWRKWVEHFVAESFPGQNSAERAAVEQQLIDLYDLNGKRRPEALNASVYHPCHENEASRMHEVADTLWTASTALYEHFPQPAKDAYYSMVHQPLKASVNLLDMHLNAAVNAHYAQQARPVANTYAERVAECMQEDEALCAEYAAFRDGKWSGMELEAHIGFTVWNEDGCKMPLRTYVYPWKEPRLSASRADSAPVYGKKYGSPMVITVHDFCDEGVDEVQLEIANAGVGELTWRIEGEADWLTVSPREGKTTGLDIVTLTCDHSLLIDEVEPCLLTIHADDCQVQVDVTAALNFPNDEPAYMPVKKVVTIDAPHFCDKYDVEGAAFRVLPGYGRSGNAVKVFPNTAAFAPDADAPSLTYRFLAEKQGEYTCELWLTPTSPVQPKTAMRCTVNGQVVTCVPADYRAGENSDPRWCHAMVNHIRKVKTAIGCEKGVNEVTIGAVDPNFILERILIYPADHVMPESYLGPQESACI